MNTSALGMAQTTLEAPKIDVLHKFMKEMNFALQ